MNTLIQGARQTAAHSLLTKERLFHVSLLSFILFASLALKRRYGVAGPEELDWLLVPTASLVELFIGHHFFREAGVGFVAEKLPIIIAPGCAGLNFFVVALLTLSFGFVGTFPTPWRKLVWCGACPTIAYGATMMANTIRITSAVWIHETGFRAPVLSAPEAHRALGVVVYLPCLWAMYAVAERCLKRAVP
jgi:exosortase K